MQTVCPVSGVYSECARLACVFIHAIEGQHPQCRDSSIDEPLASTLGALAIPGILWDVGDEARMEDVTDNSLH